LGKAPAVTPTAIANKIASDVQKAITRKEVHLEMRTRGVEPVFNTPQQFAAILRVELAKWSRIIKEDGTKPE